MDLSKLPRLSETDKHAPPSPAAMDAQVESASTYQPQLQVRQIEPLAAPPDIIGGVWLSLVLGLVFMLMGGTFARYAIAKLTGQEFHTHVDWNTGPKAGQEVAYFELQGYTAYTDAAIFLFGLAMVLEAAMLVMARNNTPASRAFVAVAMGISGIMTIFNIVVCGLLFQNGVTPLISLLAAGFGAYMTATEWSMLQRMRLSARA